MSNSSSSPTHSISNTANGFGSASAQALLPTPLPSTPSPPPSIPNSSSPSPPPPSSSSSSSSPLPPLSSSSSSFSAPPTSSPSGSSLHRHPSLSNPYISPSGLIISSGPSSSSSGSNRPLYPNSSSSSSSSSQQQQPQLSYGPNGIVMLGGAPLNRGNSLSTSSSSSNLPPSSSSSSSTSSGLSSSSSSSSSSGSGSSGSSNSSNSSNSSGGAQLMNLQHIKQSVMDDAKLAKYKTVMCQRLAKDGVCRFAGLCDFAHDRNELRRNLTMHYYYGVRCEVKMCEDQTCKYSHNDVEIMYHPDVYKTKLCANYDEMKKNGCSRGNYCSFGHGKLELRPKKLAQDMAPPQLPNGQPAPMYLSSNPGQPLLPMPGGGIGYGIGGGSLVMGGGVGGGGGGGGNMPPNAIIPGVNHPVNTITALTPITPVLGSVPHGVQGSPAMRALAQAQAVANAHLQKQPGGGGGGRGGSTTSSPRLNTIPHTSQYAALATNGVGGPGGGVGGGGPVSGGRDSGNVSASNTPLHKTIAHHSTTPSQHDADSLLPNPNDSHPHGPGGGGGGPGGGGAGAAAGGGGEMSAADYRDATDQIKIRILDLVDQISSMQYERALMEQDKNHSSMLENRLQAVERMLAIFSGSDELLLSQLSFSALQNLLSQQQTAMDRVKTAMHRLKLQAEKYNQQRKTGGGDYSPSASPKLSAAAQSWSPSSPYLSTGGGPGGGGGVVSNGPPSLPSSCVSCRINPITSVIQPCGHQLLCHVCNPLVCPLCGASVVSVNPIIHALPNFQQQRIALTPNGGLIDQ